MAIITVNIKKAGQTMEVDTDKLPLDLYAEFVRIGAEHALNTKQSKVATPTAQKSMSETDAAAERDSAMKIAQTNLEAIYANKFKVGRKAAGNANKVTREVNTEAMRLARITIKDAIVAAGERISHVKASDISAAAKDLIAQEPEYIEKAKANIEANKVTPKPTMKLDISALISPELVAKTKAKTESAKAKSAGIMSATQAGLVKGKRKAPDATT